MTQRRPGRPSEMTAPGSRTLHVRLTEGEHEALGAIAARLNQPVSRLVRRAVREIVNEGPDFFEDGLERFSRLVAQLAALERAIRAHGKLEQTGAAAALSSVEALRRDLASVVRASRDRWVDVAKHTSAK